MTVGGGVEFGVYLPTGWRSEFTPITDPSEQWSTILRIGQLAESIGYDTLWAGDHLHTIPGWGNTSVFDSWTVLTALSQVTSQIRLGHMVSCAAFRAPALMAKITASIDVLSGGRFIWGIGAGWHEDEFRGYGFPWRTPADRAHNLRETVEIVKRMWSEPEVTYKGRFHSIEGARCDPKPLQDPHPPVLIGAWGEQIGSWLVAEHADRCNFPGDNATVVQKLSVLRDRCERLERDESEILKSWTGELHLRESEKEITGSSPVSLYPTTMEDWRRTHIVGTPAQAGERLEELIGLGIESFCFSICDFPDTTSMEIFAESVLPRFEVAKRSRPDPRPVPRPSPKEKGDAHDSYSS